MSRDTVFKKQNIDVGILGGGLMAKAHAIAWSDVQVVDRDVPFTPHVVIVCYATNEIAAAVRAQRGYKRGTTSWREAIDVADVHVVDIVTPNFLSKEVTKAAAKAGKHMWCEKPLALTAENAPQMAQVAEEAGAGTFVDFSYLRNRGLALAKRLIESGQSGYQASSTAAFALDAMVNPLTPFAWRQNRTACGHRGVRGSWPTCNTQSTIPLWRPRPNRQPETSITKSDFVRQTP